jgi:eukaryotic-like serine/threonine-protein kinase
VLALDLVIDRRYRVEQLLGRGGMAEVYRAMDTEAGQPVAVKLLRDVDGGDLERFRIEVAALTRLDHPGVIKLLGSGSHEGVPFLVLELVEGRSLADALVDGPLGFDRSVGAAGHVAGALAHAHRLTVVHRDVKPANVLFDADGRPRLSDFGTARLAGMSGVTATGMVIGTAHYLAPEQVKGHGVGAPADVYALGLVVLECLTGTRCYAGTWTEAALARLHRPPDIPEDLPAWLREVLAAMTALDPSRRPSAEAAAEAFDRRSAQPLSGATVKLMVPVTTTAMPLAVTATAAVERISTMRFAPATSSGALRSSAAHHRSRLAAVAAASVAFAVPAWLFASSDPQAADAPPAPTPASTAARPASTSTTVVQLSSPRPHPVAQDEGGEQATSPDGNGGAGGGGDHGGGGKSGPGKDGPGKGGGGKGSGSGH